MQQASVSAAIDGVEQAEIDALGERLRGRILQPSDGDYEGACRVWNGMIDRRPGLIVQCAGTSDVVAAVELAAAHDLSVAVRGRGHNVAGTAMPDEALVVDLSPMRGVRVDAGRQTVWAQGGCTWGDVDRETQLHGLAVPGGVVSETGIAGLTLAGGYSNQRRAHGMSIDNLLACELVTADGRCLRTSESEHPELFWALRGGGGNFGVVTGFEYRAHRHGPDVYHIEVIYPIERARETLAAWRDTLAGAPDAITSDATLWAFPAIPDIPSELHGVPCLFVEAYFVGAVDEVAGRAATAARARCAPARPQRRLDLSRAPNRARPLPPLGTSLLLERALPRPARRRGDRPDRRAVGRCTIASITGRDPAARRGDRAGPGRRDCLRRPQRPLSPLDRRKLGAPSRRHAKHRLGPLLLERRPTLLDRPHLLQLRRAARRRRKRGAHDLRPQLPAPRRGQDHLRPRQTTSATTTTSRHGRRETAAGRARRARLQNSEITP
jgi:hypothetical protein